MIAFIDAHRAVHGVEPIYRVLPIAPSTYRAHAARRANPSKAPARSRSDAELSLAIRRVWDANFQVYGVRKVWRQLRREGVDVAHCTVARLMRHMGPKGATRGKAVRTTLSDRAAPCPLDRVKRQFQTPRPNALWVADFTYVATWQGFVYVAFVIEHVGPPVSVRLAVNADSLATWFVAAMAETPDCLFDLVIDDQEHSAAWLRRGEVLAAVTASAKPVQGCDSKPLGALRYIATASPTFVRRYCPEGVDAGSLARAPCLTFNAKDRLQTLWTRQVFGTAIAAPTHWLPSSQAFVDATLAGLGWGMNPESLVADPLRDGRLVALVPGRPLDVQLVWQRSRIASRTLADITRAVLGTARATLRQP